MVTEIDPHSSYKMRQLLMTSQDMKTVAVFDVTAMRTEAEHAVDELTDVVVSPDGKCVVIQGMVSCLRFDVNTGSANHLDHKWRGFQWSPKKGLFSVIVDGISDVLLIG